MGTDDARALAPAPRHLIFITERQTKGRLPNKSAGDVLLRVFTDLLEALGSFRCLDRALELQDVSSKHFENDLLTATDEDDTVARAQTERIPNLFRES